MKKEIKAIFGWKTNFFSGLLILLPIASTSILIWWLFNKLTQFAPKLFKGSGNESLESLAKNPIFNFSIQIIAILIALGIIYFVGLVARHYLGKRSIKMGEKVIGKIPLVRTVYHTIRQIVDTVFKQQSKMFRQVALIEYPSPGIHVIGFVTSETPESICQLTDHEEMTSVFVPTTPNPTSGFLIFLPHNKVKILDMTVTEGMQLVISGGAVKPSIKGAKDES